MKIISVLIAMSAAIVLLPPPQLTGVKMLSTIQGIRYISQATPEEMKVNKWSPGEAENAGFNSIITSAASALNSCVEDDDKWALNILSLCQHDDTGTWYWQAHFIHRETNDEVLLGVHLDAKSFPFEKY